jgi:hypothetical protein
MGMVNAMGAISILGFIVWAQLGQYVVNFILNIIYFMLEFRINQQDCNSLFCVLYLSKPVNLHKIKLKSIETTRRYTLNHYNDQSFIDWFIGFSEGDGGFYTYNENTFMFKIRQKESKILYTIQNFFKFGSVFKSQDGYYTYNVGSKNDLLTLIYIFNGKLLLEKKNNDFKNFVYAFNKYHNYNIIIKAPLDINNLEKDWLLSNAWLSGFVDADGSFFIKLSKATDRPLGKRLRLGWYVDQSYELTFMYNLKHILKASIEKKSEKALRVKIDSFTGLKKIFNYFEKYAPRTIKLSVRFLRFKIIYNYALQKTWAQHLKYIEYLIFLNKNEIYELKEKE